MIINLNLIGNIIIIIIIVDRYILGIADPDLGRIHIQINPDSDFLYNDYYITITLTTSKCYFTL